MNYEESILMQKPEIQGVDRSEKHPFMQKIKDLITSYAYDLMKEQFILSSVYKVEKINFSHIKLLL